MANSKRILKIFRRVGVSFKSKLYESFKTYTDELLKVDNELESIFKNIIKMDSNLDEPLQKLAKELINLQLNIIKYNSVLIEGKLQETIKEVPDTKTAEELARYKELVQQLVTPLTDKTVKANTL